jgi:hypothetical protein
MHIELPNGDKLIPDAEFLKLAGNVDYRTGLNWDKEGCPYIKIGSRKYRPKNEALTWLAARIERKNPRRTSFPPSLRRSKAPVTLPRLPDTS